MFRHHRQRKRRNTPLARRLWRRLAPLGLKALCDETDACILRTYAGPHQRSLGAWSWELVNTDGGQAAAFGVGSRWPAKICAQAESLTVETAADGGAELIPDKPPAMTDTPTNHHPFPTALTETAKPTKKGDHQ